MKWLWPLVLLCAILPQPVFAIDPGRVRGSLQVNDNVIVITQAYALLHDNAEGLLDRPQELRLLLVDREVPQEALAGIALLPVEQMAKEGRVQGLLLRLDPRDHTHLSVTLLYPPTEPEPTLLTRTISTTGRKPPLELKIGGSNRVGGAVEHHEDHQPETRGMPKLNYSLRFSAPLFHETPVTAVLVGRQAQNSSQLRVLREKARALEQGDFASVQRLSTIKANLRNRALLAGTGPEAESLSKRAAAELKELTKYLQRLVVRGDRAVAIFAGKQWITFMREDGEWKVDNSNIFQTPVKRSR
jgi:hypothetical protein